jgi:hypothetical protein
VSDERFFDDAFLQELQELASGEGALARADQGARELEHGLSTLLADEAGGTALSLDELASLPVPQLLQRTDRLLELCRGGPSRSAVQAVENFVVFFQALVPTLKEEGADQVRRVFARLVPTLIQIAYNDFGSGEEDVAEGRAALGNLETILIDIAGVRLAPQESELVYRSIDQVASFMAVGEYAMASRVVSAQLLDLIERNKLTRALYRLMEAEVAVQRYIKERLGYTTPQFVLPDDLQKLSEYGPIQVLEETSLEGAPQRLLQVQVPGIPRLTDVVVHLVAAEGGAQFDLRMDALGMAPLALPGGRYALGLAYEPLEAG